MRTIPGKVIVAGRKYKISITTDEEKIREIVGSKEYVAGACSEERQEIVILKLPYMNDEFIQDTVLHEIIHAILFSYMPSGELDNEAMTILLTTGFGQVFLDNPKLVEFFLPKKKEATEVGNNTRAKDLRKPSSTAK